MEGNDPQPLLRGAGLDAESKEQAFSPRPSSRVADLLRRIGGAAGPDATQLPAESLDYEPIQNDLFHERQGHLPQNRKVYGYTGQTLAKFVVVTCTGIITGLLAALIGYVSATATNIRNDLIDNLMTNAQGTPQEHQSIVSAFIFYWFWSSVILSLAAILVQLYAPKAAGAGVSLVMAYLNGNHVPDLLRLRTLVVKVVGTICTCSASLAVGPEGPMVHIGAAVASTLTHFHCYLDSVLCCVTRRRTMFAPAEDAEEEGAAACVISQQGFNDADQREFVSAGTAAGLAAAFGAPIGGVMFAMEEACSFWSRKVAWRCFLAAVFAVLTIAQLNHRVNLGLLSFDGLGALQNTEWLVQAPFIALTAAAAALLGVAFNFLRNVLSHTRAPLHSHLRRILEVLAVGLVTCLVFFLLSYRFGTCVPRKQAWVKDYGLQFGCPEGHLNDLATALFSVPEETVRQLYSLGDGLPKKERCTPASCLFSKRALALVTASYLLMMSLAAGTAVPAGLFMPSILIGGAGGTLVGMFLQDHLSGITDIQPGLYGLVGSTAMLGGVFRSSISLVVIVVEGTHSIDFLIGIIIAVVVSSFVGHLLNADGVYESEIERNRAVFFLRHEPPRALRAMSAEDVMASPVRGFRCIESVERVIRALRSTSHNGFPVFERDSQGTATHLEGMILRSQLLVLLEKKAFCRVDGQSVSPMDIARLDREMGQFYRRKFKHRRHLISASQAVDTILVDWMTASQQTLVDWMDSIREEDPESGWVTPQPTTMSGVATPGGHEAGQPGTSTLTSTLAKRSVRKEGSEESRESGTSEGADDASGVTFKACAPAASDGGGDGGVGGAGGAGSRHAHASSALRGKAWSGAASTVEAAPRHADMSGFGANDDSPAGDGAGEGEGAGASVSGLGSVPLSRSSSLGHALHEALRELYVDLRPFMNRAPLSVRKETSAFRVHQAFVLLGLRHLCVVDAQNHVVGIVTRKDLDAAAGHGHWRRTPPVDAEDGMLGHGSPGPGQSPRRGRHSRTPTAG